MSTALTQLSNYWYVYGGATLVISVLSYIFDKFICDEKDFLDGCILTKNQNISKKSELLKVFIEKIKSNFDNAQEIEQNTYTNLICNLTRHNSYDVRLDKIRGRFKCLRNVLLGIIILSFILFTVGFLLINARIYISVTNILLIILVVIIIFWLRGLNNKLDNIKNEPDLISQNQ